MWEQRLGSKTGPLDNAHNLRVVRTATALNLPFTDASQAPETDWEQQGDKVRQRYKRLAEVPLSAFGWATAAAAYGVHRLTWHMEHGGLPPEAAVDRLDGWTARLIDRRQEPEAIERGATGIPRSLLPGHPTVGGCGARWVTAALRYIGSGESREGALAEGDGRAPGRNLPEVASENAPHGEEGQPVAGGPEPAGGHSEDNNGPGPPAPVGGRRGDPANPRDLVLERTLVGQSVPAARPAGGGSSWTRARAPGPDGMQGAVDPGQPGQSAGGARKGDGGMERRTGGEDGPRGSQGQPGLESLRD